MGGPSGGTKKTHTHRTKQNCIYIYVARGVQRCHYRGERISIAGCGLEAYLDFVTK